MSHTHNAPTTSAYTNPVHPLTPRQFTGRLLSIVLSGLLSACIRNGYPSQTYTCTAEANGDVASSTIGVRFEHGKAYLSGDEHVYFGGIPVCPQDSRYEATRDQIYLDTKLCGTADYQTTYRWLGKFNRLTKQFELLALDKLTEQPIHRWNYSCSKVGLDPTT